jgi:endonuclease/exonuclease/phosphatase family metal-dependent hydrolase
MLRTVVVFFVSLSLIAYTGCATRVGDHYLSVAFYNCENFFDTIHNPAKEDEEFTPQGKYHYTQKIYEQKLHNIVTVLQNMGGADGPAIIGLAEVENATVLSDLVRQPELARRSYRYEWYDGPDPRGINVALLYNPRHFVVLGSEARHVDISGTGGKTVTRDMLHVYGVLDGDTVHVLVNHWPSRRGGEEESGPKRVIAARVNKTLIDSLMKTNARTELILMGDLNDNPDDSDITGLLGAKATQNEVSATDLYNPWIAMFKGGAGTEEYRHTWNLFDQIMLSGAFLHNPNHKLRYDHAEIFKPDFITDHYKGHEGEPHRSFVGTHWISGYSDHFPVIVYFNK